MQADLFIPFIGASFLLAIMPGPDNLFVLTESLIKGKRNGIAISLGLSSGVLIHTLAVATGISIIIQKSELVFTFLKIFGAAYLLYLAMLSWREKRKEVDIDSNHEETQKDFLKLVKTGLIMNVLNPKVSIFFIAFLPQFVDTGGNVTNQMIVLGITFMIITILTFSGIAILSGKLRNLLYHERFWNASKWIKTAVLILLAIGIFVTH